MSNEENTTESSASATPNATTDAPKAKPGSNALATILELKEKNPKVFFGAVGGIVLLLAVSMMGGNNEVVGGSKLKELAIGQHYVLKSANAADPTSTIRLVSTPGTMAAYDDSEQADREGVCQHLPQGTPVTVLQLADAFGRKNTYAKVKIEDGPCKDNPSDSWALSIDVQ